MRCSLSKKQAVDYVGCLLPSHDMILVIDSVFRVSACFFSLKDAVDVMLDKCQNIVLETNQYAQLFCEASRSFASALLPSPQYPSLDHALFVQELHLQVLVENITCNTLQ